MPEELPQTFLFDGHFYTGGTLTFSMTRGYATVDPGGNAVTGTGNNGPRYFHYPRLLCGAPVVRQDIAPSDTVGGSFFVYGGFNANGTTPCILCYFVDPGNVKVFSLDSNGAISTELYSKNIAYPGEGTSSERPRNLLKGSDSETNVICYSPVGRSFTLCHGLLLSHCQVFDFGEDGWQVTRTAVAYYDLSNPTSNWIAVDIGFSANSQEGKARGAPFQTGGYRVIGNLSSGKPLRAYFPVGDYVNNGQSGNTVFSDIAIFYLIDAQRSTIGGSWTVGSLFPVLTTPTRYLPSSGYDTSAQGQHSHTAYVERFGESGLRMVCAIGDAASRNRVATATRSDENYSSSAWANHDDLHGSHYTSTSQDRCGEGNQFVGHAPIGGPSSYAGHIIGSDEMLVPLCRLVTPASATEKLNFTRLYGQPPCSVNTTVNPDTDLPINVYYVWNTFFVATPGAEVGGPYAALVTPGSQLGWSGTTEPVRVLISFDGVTFGPCWAPNVGPDAPLAVAGGRIFFAGKNDSRTFGLRSIPIPASRTLQPVCVGPGATSILGSVSVSATETGNSATLLTSTQVGNLPVKPPCLGPVYDCRVGTTSMPTGLTRIGIFRLTADGAVGLTGSPGRALVKLKGFILPLPCDGSGQPHANCAYVNAALGRVSPIPGGGNLVDLFASSREQIAVGSLQTVGELSLSSPPAAHERRGWIPFTFDTDTLAWRDETTGGTPITPPTADFALGLRLSSGVDGFPPNPQAFLIAFDSVVVGGDYPDVPAPASGGSFADEQASIGGFSAGSIWTVRIAGELSESGPDGTVSEDHRTSNRVLFTLWQSSTSHVQVKADFHARTLTLEVNGSSSVSLSANGASSNIEKFDFQRGMPLLLAVSKAYNAQTQSAVYKLFASVGGTTVASTSLTVSGTGVQPTQLRFGNASSMNPEGMNWYGGTIDEGTTLSDSAITTSLQDLGFLPVEE